MAATILAETFISMINRFSRAVLGVECPDGKVRIAQGNANGDIKTEVTGGTLTAVIDTSAMATAAKQDTGNTSLATMAEGDYLVSVTATTFDPPLRGLVNNGTAGKITVKAQGDTVAKELYLAQGGQYSMTRIKEVTAIAAGMDVVGTR